MSTAAFPHWLHLLSAEATGQVQDVHLGWMNFDLLVSGRVLGRLRRLGVRADDVQLPLEQIQERLVFFRLRAAAVALLSLGAPSCGGRRTAIRFASRLLRDPTALQKRGLVGWRAHGAVLARGATSRSLGVRGLFSAKVPLRVLPQVQHVGRRQTQDFAQATDLIVLRMPREDRQPQEELGADAAQAPHVNRARVRQADQHLRGPVEARLYVGVHGVALETSGTEIDQFDLGMLHVAQQDVLGLQVAVYDEGLPQAAHGLQKLLGEHADEGHTNATEIVLFQDLVQVYAQQLKRDAKMLPEHEKVQHPDDPIIILSRELIVKHLENTDLDEGLVKVCGLVLDDLQSHGSAATSGLALEHLAEAPMAESFEDFVSLTIGVDDCVSDSANVVVLRVIVTAIVNAFRQFRQNASWRSLQRVPELSRAPRVGLDEVYCERLQMVSVLPLFVVAGPRRRSLPDEVSALGRRQLRLV
mmetsp:Transcript_41593/g.114637  ORF Transcript_41593/g.114637 Transcript_41593/m.114637 type:complete len:471 (+) Transcript_41593:2036-3448(+)